ncbi:MAG: Gfo/Idh/MocA family oxidoreductase, partial [Kiritimatiellaeota bacterium]|nr:Gfo/Idh/MocA family oxidoreductase [Kiritimatiellota bacterium]
MAAKPVKTAILGLGRIGWNHHLQFMRRRKDFEIVAVADPLRERLDEAEKEVGCETYATPASLLNNCDAELVVVATRSVDHAKHTLQCLNAGKHVLLEKPAATRLKDMDEMMRVAKKRRLVFTVHHNNRFSDMTMYFKKTIESGILGDVFEIKMINHLYQLRNDWQTLKKNGGGHIFNFGSHWIDAAIFLMGGEIKEVWGDLKHLVAAGDADDCVKVLMRNDAGIIADLDFSLAAQFTGDMFLIMGTRGTISANQSSATLTTFKSDLTPGNMEVVDAAAPGRVYGQVAEKIKLKTKTIKKYPKSGVDFYGNLAKAIRRGEELIITPESVREQLRVIF